jgi:hypothetical protein
VGRRWSLLSSWILLLPVAEGGEMTLSITSSAFAPNGEIPRRFTCEGEDLSPPLAWTGAPAGTKSFALVVDDPDAPDPAAPKTTWMHRVLNDLPADQSRAREGDGRSRPRPRRAGRDLSEEPARRAGRVAGAGVRR